MKHSILFLSVIAFCGWISSCKKKDTLSLDFFYSGDQLVGKNIRFTSNADGHSTFLWQFGDGSFSTDAMPFHTFMSNKNYTVTLTVNNGAINTISKQVNINVGANRVAGNYAWSRAYFFHLNSGAYPDTTYTLPDTSFDISLLNDSTLRAWNRDLPFFGPKSPFGSMVFGHYPVAYGDIRVYYDDIADSIFLVNDFSGQSKVSYYTYKTKK